MGETLVESAPLRRFRRYPGYRHSGVEWLGKIPDHWDALKMWCISRAISGGTPARDHPAYWGGDIPWVSPKDMKRRLIGSSEDTITEEALEETGLKLIPPPVVLIVVRGMILAHTFPVAITTEPVTINQDMKALRLRQGVDPSFLSWFFEGLGRGILGAVVDEAAHGTRVIRMERWRSLQAPVPPAEEQRAIVAFLDRETARIDDLVARKERLIELLEEKRGALVTRAVTKGLAPDVPMKNSGVEWLGETPAHWKILALSHLSVSRCDGPFGSGLKSEHYSGSGVRVIRLQNIGSGTFIDRDRAFITEGHAAKLGDHGVLSGDLLVAGLGDPKNPVGRACVAPEAIEPAMVKADCFRFRLDEQRALPRFVAYQLSSTAASNSGFFSTGATRSRINLGSTAQRLIALPPINEQQLIVESLDRDQAVQSSLLARIQTAITHLHELRTALISAAVTGKIDVREEAA